MLCRCSRRFATGLSIHLTDDSSRVLALGRQTLWCVSGHAYVTVRSQANLHHVCSKSAAYELIDKGEVLNY